MSRERGPVCVSVINMKGGVGKTTAVALLGRHAARMDRRVLVVDLDPQANLSQAYMGHAYRQFLENKEPSIVELFDGYRPPTLHRESPTRLNPVATVREVYAGGTLSYIPSRFDFSDNLVRAMKPDPQVLAHYIANYFQEKNLVLIDCPPTESVFTRAAYHASRYVLVPCAPSILPPWGFLCLRSRSIHSGPKTHRTTLKSSGVVINNGFYDGGNDGGPEKRRAMPEIFEEAHENNWHVFENQIPHSRGFPKLMRGDRSYGGNSSRFRLFAEEFFDRLGLGDDN